MHSSMILCVTSRSTARTLRTWPRSSSSIFASGKSKSIAPRLLAHGRERLVDGVQMLQRRLELGVLPARPRRDEHAGGLGVREPRRRAHHGVVETRARHLAAARHLHLADQAQPVDVRIQRAQARSTAPRAASARRGRGSRPTSRARAPRGRAASRRARSGSRRRSRRAAASRRPAARSTRRRRNRFASAPSIVTSGTPRKSSRPSFAFSGTSADQVRASASASAGHSFGMPCARIATSVSMPL